MYIAKAGRNQKKDSWKLLLTDWLYGHKLLTVMAVCAVFLAVWLWPVHFAAVDPGDVESIRLFDGNTGTAATVTDPQEIEQVVTSLQRVPMRRSFDLSGFVPHDGTGLHVNVKFKDSGREYGLEMAGNTVTQNGFRYQAYSGELPYHSLKGLCPQTK